jgi:uncharacterized spore protein YtfJ
VTVFGDPVQCDGVTVVPVARVVACGRGGREVDQTAERAGDGGRAGLIIRPVGAFMINDGLVAWKPAVIPETVAFLVMVALTWLAKGGIDRLRQSSIRELTR